MTISVKRGLWLGLIAVFGCRGGSLGESEVDLRSSALTIQPAISFSLTIQTPHLISPTGVVLGAAGSLIVDSSAKITQAGTTPSVSSNMGSGGVDVEPDAVLGDTWSVSTVTLKDRVHVKGTVFAPGVVPGSGVIIDHGTNTTTARTPATVTSWSITYPATTVSDVSLAPNQTGSQAPGRYGAVKLAIGAKLTLSAGSYFLDSIDLEPSSVLILSQDAGPVFVYVRNSPILRGTLSTTSGGSPDLLLGYVGTTEMIVEMPFIGTIVAPNAKVTLATVTGGHQGAFFAKTIEVRSGVMVTFRAPHNILTTQPLGTPEACAAAIQPDNSLAGNAREVRYQSDILRYCTGIGISACEQTIRARMNVDFALAAASIYASRMTTGTYVAILRDRESKLHTFRANPTLACAVAAHDGDGDYVPDSADACKNTPPLTPVLANGCTNTNIAPGPNITEVQNVMSSIGVEVDPRCVNAPQPAIPAPLGAFRYPPDPSQGKAIWISRDSGVTTCPLYYQIEVTLTDGSGRRPTTFQASEDTNLSWISKPAGAVQFNIHATDSGNRGAWGSYAVFTETFRVRAFNYAGRASAWSNDFTISDIDCVAGQPCLDQ